MVTEGRLQRVKWLPVAAVLYMFGCLNFTLRLHDIGSINGFCAATDIPLESGPSLKRAAIQAQH